MSKVLIFFTALLLLAIQINSQTKWQLGAYGGYSLPMGDLEGTFPDTLGISKQLNFSTARTLLAKSGYNFGAIVKYATDTTGTAKLTGGMGYSLFTGSKDYVVSPGVNRSYKSRVSIFTISAGAEYSLNPGKKISPYFGLSLAANFFGGDIESKGDTSFVLNRTQETRAGVIADLGLNYSASSNVGIILGVRYALANLIGRSTETTTGVSTSNTDDEGGSTIVFFELPLNDAETSTNKSKSFSYFQFYLGIIFNIGEPLK